MTNQQWHPDGERLAYIDDDPIIEVAQCLMLQYEASGHS